MWKKNSIKTYLHEEMYKQKYYLAFFYIENLRILVSNNFINSISFIFSFLLSFFLEMLAFLLLQEPFQAFI
jgi:hypothetical protein